MSWNCIQSAIKENTWVRANAAWGSGAVCKSPHNHSPEIFLLFFFFLAAWLCHVRLLTPWGNCSPSGFFTTDFHKEYWVGCHFTQGSLNQEIEPSLCICIGGDSYHWATRKLYIGSNLDQQDHRDQTPLAPALEVRSPNHWLPQKSCSCCFELLPFLWKTRSFHIWCLPDFLNNSAFAPGARSWGVSTGLAYVILDYTHDRSMNWLSVRTLEAS